MKKRKAFFILLMSSLAVFLLSACQSETKETTKKKESLTVVTTFYPMYEFTRQIVGTAGNVELLIPAGSDSHDFEPSAKDIAKIADADAFVYNHEAFETWVPSALENIDQKAVTVIEASEGISFAEDHDHDHEGEAAHDHDHDHELDPHVWLDPVLAQKEVNTIQQALIAAFPEKKEEFTANATQYIKKLAALDMAYREACDQAANKTFVTQHAAFGYLASRYGLTQEAISGISSEQEPSPSRLAEIKSYIQEHHVSVIYFESAASSKIAKTISEETGVQLAVLNPLESLTKEEQAQGKDYLSVMEENLTALKRVIH